MRTPLALLLAFTVLGGSAAAAVLTGPNAPALPFGRDADDAPAHDAHALAPRDAASPDAHDHASHVHKAPEGTIPTTGQALTDLDRHGDILIRSDLDWTPAAGIRSGTGAPDDPFVISGLNVDRVLIADTTKCFEIKENYVADILILDWTGPCGLVHSNHLANFRTNRNVERTGDPTGAMITKNEILRVEELRHFDGGLVDNVIGRADLAALPVGLGQGVVLNIAGLNGADISRNAIYGGVDMKIHGHHHSDADGRHSHNHGQADAQQNETVLEKHNVRYVNFLFQDNTILDKGFGLRYNDLNHAGDDRTATSEQEPTLENPHEHFTSVKIVNNVIEGRGLRVSVFNAPDERHLGSVGTLLLAGNTLREPAAGSAVTIQDVRGGTVIVSGNTVTRGDDVLDSLGLGGAGVTLQRFENSTVRVEGNTLPGYDYGVVARDFDALTTWWVAGNVAPDAESEAYWDSSVPNAPNSGAGGAESAHEHEGHDHGGDEAAASAPARRDALATSLAALSRR